MGVLVSGDEGFTTEVAATTAHGCVGFYWRLVLEIVGWFEQQAQRYNQRRHDRLVH